MKSYMFYCPECDYTTPLKSNLNCHMKRHANTPATSNLLLKVVCHDPVPNDTDPPVNDRVLEQLEDEEVQCIFDQNTQRGLE